MPTVYSYPTYEQSYETWRMRGGGPAHHQVMKSKYLAFNDWDVTYEIGDADIVHGHGVTSLPGMDVLTIHAVWPTHIYPDHPAFWDEHNAKMAAVMQQVGQVVALSEYTAGLCRELAGVDVTVVPQAIDPEEWEDEPNYDIRTHLGIPADMPLVIWGKNAVDVLRDPTAAVKLAEAKPDIAVVMTAERDQVIAQSGQMLTENVFCIGTLAFPAMRNLLHASDIYLATTIESSGQGHLEAMYLGKPVLGYKWGGVADTVPVGRYGAGELVEPGDIDSLIDAFDLVWRRRKGYGRKAAATVAKSYTWPVVIDQLIAVYEEAMQ